jgi:hypothetical protein
LAFEINELTYNNRLNPADASSGAELAAISPGSELRTGRTGHKTAGGRRSWGKGMLVFNEPAGCRAERRTAAEDIGYPMRV